MFHLLKVRIDIQLQVQHAPEHDQEERRYPQPLHAACAQARSGGAQVSTATARSMPARKELQEASVLQGCVLAAGRTPLM